MHLKRKIFVGMAALVTLSGALAFTKYPAISSYVPDTDSIHVKKPAVFTHPGNSPHPQLSEAIYEKALMGFKRIASGEGIRKHLLTIVDFSRPSSEKRLFIIDMNTGKLLLHTYVAHGRNSGEKWASRFSNGSSSHQSSLGFYLTGVTYEGSNGYSLRLKGLEAGFNDRAESRAIVMHGAPYVSESVIRSTGRLGRSWGCPAVSQKEHKQIIDLIKGGSCLFIYAPEKKYLTGSQFLKESKSSAPI